ncbi:hypothetical protein Btru_018836 [Bulinus truncatus]|nr:hypothetical protein Btru_018836 [Bulinus truncatus]
MWTTTRTVYRLGYVDHHTYSISAGVCGPPHVQYIGWDMWTTTRTVYRLGYVDHHAYSVSAGVCGPPRVQYIGWGMWTTTRTVYRLGYVDHHTYSISAGVCGPPHVQCIGWGMRTTTRTVYRLGYVDHHTYSVSAGVCGPPHVQYIGWGYVDHHTYSISAGGMWTTTRIYRFGYVDHHTYSISAGDLCVREGFELKMTAEELSRASALIQRLRDDKVFGDQLGEKLLSRWIKSFSNREIVFKSVLCRSFGLAAGNVSAGKQPNPLVTEKFSSAAQLQALTVTVLSGGLNYRHPVSLSTARCQTHIQSDRQFSQNFCFKLSKLHLMSKFTDAPNGMMPRRIDLDIPDNSYLIFYGSFQHYPLHVGLNDWLRGESEGSGVTIAIPRASKTGTCIPGVTFSMHTWRNVQHAYLASPTGCIPGGTCSMHTWRHLQDAYLASPAACIPGVTCSMHTWRHLQDAYLASPSNPLKLRETRLRETRLRDYARRDYVRRDYVRRDYARRDYERRDYVRRDYARRDETTRDETM